ncbi:hypothetical protein SAMN05216490_0563 [Mucilaginibacter mallensis]|uniref:Uncharacterized protein n=1 Tax=Mucilaginibacter mallensis TaxID=652787 RepID=A0A1H1PJK5_MUCMA|nr:hypothetical protein [Mucilaginibacter mallensis]SDS11260.1 hypothetical protein SAMN05216490_0563 [Mucilaginibacter mallensis]
MEFIQIPLPDFSFDEIAKEKAKSIIQHVLHQSSLMQYFTGSNLGLKDRLEIQVSELYEDYERLICIVELLNFLVKEESILKNNISFNTRDPSQIATGFNKIRYVLYSLAKKSANYTFDKNTFSLEEIADINSKIDNITYTLTKLEAGQEVIFNEFEEIKSHISSEFEALKSLPVLGKKTFYELMFGKIATFTGDKIADEIFKILTPQIIALLTLQAPHLVEGFQKLIK